MAMTRNADRNVEIRAIRENDRITIKTTSYGLLGLLVTDISPDRSAPGVAYVAGHEIDQNGRADASRPRCFAVSGSADGAGVQLGGSCEWTWWTPTQREPDAR